MFEMKSGKYGDFIYYEDYFALKNEYDALRSSSFTTAVPAEAYDYLKAEKDHLAEKHEKMIDEKLDEISRLKHEVERLTKLQLETQDERNEAEKEVERMSKHPLLSKNSNWQMISLYAEAKEEISKLQEQIERLNGFMEVVSNIWRDRNINNGASLIFMDTLLLRYNQFKEGAAKEGKQSK